MLSSNYNTGFIVVLHRTVLEALSDITIAEFRQILTSCEPFVLVHWLFPESLGHLGYIIFVPLKFVVRFFSPELLLSITTFAWSLVFLIFPRLLLSLMQVFGARTRVTIVLGVIFFVAGILLITITFAYLFDWADWDQLHLLEHGFLLKISLGGWDFYFTIRCDLLELLNFLLQGEVSTLQILDELMLRLHDNDLLVQSLLQLKVYCLLEVSFPRLLIFALNCGLYWHDGFEGSRVQAHRVFVWLVCWQIVRALISVSFRLIFDLLISKNL